MNVFAVDPGTTHSGWVRYSPFDMKVVEASSGMENGELLKMLHSMRRAESHSTHLAVEMIESYGMAVGREVFQTCVWIGRFYEAYGTAKLIGRKDVKLLLCGSARAKDPNVSRAILDAFPATGGGSKPQVGTKKQKGPLYGVSGHAWSALGVALTYCDFINVGGLTFAGTRRVNA